MTKELVKKPVDRLNELINKSTVQKQFQNALGKHSDLFVASLIDAFNNGLQNCEPGGVIQEALKAAVLKLPISKSLGFAYLVPYGGQAQFQIGYKGMIQLAMRSGQVKILNAGAVYEGEFKSFDKLTGIVDLSGEKKNEKVVGYFCYMELINGFRKCEYWTDKEIKNHAQKFSKSYNNKRSAWVTDFDAMATKTVLRSMLGKYAPMSIEFITAIGNDKADDDAGQSEPEKVGFKDLTDKGSKTERPKPSKDMVKDDNKKVEKSDSAKNAHTEDSSKKKPTELTEEERRQIEEDEFNELIDS